MHYVNVKTIIYPPPQQGFAPAPPTPRHKNSKSC